MVKRNITISIQENIHDEVKKLNLNISQTIEDFLGTLINQKITDAGIINVQLERIKKEELEKEITNKAGELKKVLLNIDRVEELQNRNKIKALEQEKEEIEKQTKCINCGNVFGIAYKGWNTFKSGHVCRACFLTSDRDIIKKWSE